MNYSKKICALALGALAMVSPLAVLTSCSSGSSDSENGGNFPGVMTVSEFASLSRSFEIISAGSVLIQPQILMTPPDQITDRAAVFANLTVGGIGVAPSPVQVSCEYITYGSADIGDPPTGARMEVTFASTGGQNDDAIIQALGLRGIGVGNVLAGLVFTFNFQTNVVDIQANGSEGTVAQPGEDSGGENTDYQEQIYGKRYAIRVNSL